MWRNRYDDLWLYPMPTWFVRTCNCTIGAYVFDLMLLGVIAGLALTSIGAITGRFWMLTLGYVLLAPVPLLIIMMIITAQYRLRKGRTSSQYPPTRDTPHPTDEAEAISLLEQRLPLAAEPSKAVRLLSWCDADCAIDALTYELWYAGKSLWLHTVGGVAGVDLWRGPGQLSEAWIIDVLHALSSADSQTDTTTFWSRVRTLLEAEKKSPA